MVIKSYLHDFTIVFNDAIKKKRILLAGGPENINDSILRFESSQKRFLSLEKFGNRFSNFENEILGNIEAVTNTLINFYNEE